MFGAILLEVLFVYGGIAQLYIPMGVVVIACVLGVTPSRVGGTAVAYEHEPDAVDEIVDRPREIHRSLDADRRLWTPAGGEIGAVRNTAA